MQSFIHEYKRKQRSKSSTVKLQSWVRMMKSRRKFLRWRKRRIERKKKIFYVMYVKLRVDHLSRYHRLKKCFRAIRREADDSNKVKKLLEKMSRMDMRDGATSAMVQLAVGDYAGSSHTQSVLDGEDNYRRAQ